MTKLEELARKIANDADLLGSAGSSRIQAQLETALKPLLDAALDLLDNCAVSTEPDVSGLLRRCACCGAFDSKNQPHDDACHFGNLREQLSQWRSRK